MSNSAEILATGLRHLDRFWGRVAAFVGLIGLFWLGLVVLNSQRPPPKLGWENGRLTSCPEAPNCVCSQDPGEREFVEPLPCRDTVSATQELLRLQALVSGMPRTRLLEGRADYLRFEVQTPWLRFRDDLEFWADDATKMIHVRSASRLGHNDLGANRKRVEAIRALWTP